MKGFPVRIDGPSQIALFAYDNGTFIVESYLDRETDVQISVLGGFRPPARPGHGHDVCGRGVAVPAFPTGPLRRAHGIQRPPLPHSYSAFTAEK